jgi:hypothetical protein
MLYLKRARYSQTFQNLILSIGHMVAGCTEFWKIEGKILNRKFQDSPTEKDPINKEIGTFRRLNKRSFRLVDDDFEEPLKNELEEAEQRIKRKRNSYIVPERVIVEESENSKLSSSLESEPPTSKTSFDEKSSYNIFGDDEEEKHEKHEKHDKSKLSPNIKVIR